MDTIRDMLSVGEYGDGWAIWRWDGWPVPQTVATFPREDEAWGVTSLILEYVEKHGHTPERAICAAMQDYTRAWGEEYDTLPLDREPTPDDATYQDHAHIMGYVP